jgi:hypothetical protein
MGRHIENLGGLLYSAKRSLGCRLRFTDVCHHCAVVVGIHLLIEKDNSVDRQNRTNDLVENFRTTSLREIRDYFN